MLPSSVIVRRRFHVVALIAAAGLSGCASSSPRQAEARDAESEISVRVLTARDTLQARIATASGIIQPMTSVDLAFQIPGKVVAVGPDEGSVVNSGETVAELDPADYQFAVDQAQAQAARAADERDRYRPLLASGSVSSNDMEKLEALARQTAAASSLAQKRLNDARLTSPMNGIVAKRAIERGATIAPGQPVFTLMRMDSVRVRIGVPESDIGSMQLGQSAVVRVPALQDEVFDGTVSLVGIAADPMTRSFAVEITVPNQSRRLKAGMIAEANVRGGAAVRVVTLPTTVVMHAATGAALVYVFDAAKHRVHARPVTTGGIRGDAIEIASGLAAGEMVVIAGQQRLRDGSAVRLATDAAKAGAP